MTSTYPHAVPSRTLPCNVILSISPCSALSDIALQCACSGALLPGIISGDMTYEFGAAPVIVPVQDAVFEDTALLGLEGVQIRKFNRAQNYEIIVTRSLEGGAMKTVMVCTYLDGRKKNCHAVATQTFSLVSS